ncbi:MAG: GSKIP domain-containing protein [bacterium]
MDIENNHETEFPIKCLVIKDFSENYIRYDLVHSSLAQDLYSFINKLPMECFFQNYRLEIEKTGKRLNLDDNLYLLEMKDFDIVRMVPTLYDPTSAKEHFETVKYILNEHPFFVGAELQHLQDMVFRDYDKLVETSTKIYSKLNGGTPFPFYNYLMEDNLLADDDEGKDTDVSAEKDKVEEKEKRDDKTNEKDKSKKDDKADKKQRLDELEKEKAKKKAEKKYPSLEEVKQQMLDLDYKRLNLTNIPNSFIAETKNKPIKYRCLNAIYLSSFNYKIDSNEAPKGDLLYIEVVTLENRHLFITNSEKGFYVSKCQQHIYDPTPADNVCSYTLPGLLSLISPIFKENFAKTLSQNIQGDDFMFLPTPFDKFDWIVPVENPFSYSYRFKSFINEKEQQLLLNKEWNEEYQGILDIKQIEGMNLETREKLLVPFYNNFKTIALQGAKLIANKKIKPFSMSDSPASGYYIYGNIFITVLQDSGDFTVSKILLYLIF